MSTSVSISTHKTDPVCAHAPGKLILSGEHAVVYGAPALAVAVARYTEVSFHPVYPSDGLRTVFEQVSKGAFYPLSVLDKLKHSLDQRFDRFMRGELKVQQILQRPDDLIIYTLASLAMRMPMPGTSRKHHLPIPGRLESKTDLPLGAGLGSSAAVIAATIVLYEHLLGREHSADERFEMVQFCERLQHGKGGAIDAATVINGGLNRAEDGVVSQPRIDPEHPLFAARGWYCILHGTPASSTGECVMAVRQNHGQDSALWQAFGTCTNQFQTALETGESPDDCIRENQHLLEKIGVVPAATQRLISQIETAGGAAKMCGAGSVRGAFGGAVLVHQQDAEAMETLLGKYPDLRWFPLCIAAKGAALGSVSGGATCD
ncbi:MAG: GHMP kinase [Rhodobacterales bacterium]|nr:MAG: GHMP kinase [Rhodobacterales bacterium]